jgi:hypothetical protein
MKQLLSIFAFLALGLIAEAQPINSMYDSLKLRQTVSAYGYDWRNGKFGTLVLPYDTLRMAFKDSGAVAYKADTLYVWTGLRWIKPAGGGSNVIAGNQLVKSGDTLRMRYFGEETDTGLFFDPALGSIASGKDNIVTGNGAGAIGEGLRNPVTRSLVVGYLNNTDSSVINDVKFQVANGSNLFEVRGNGDLKISNSSNFGDVLTDVGGGVYRPQPFQGIRTGDNASLRSLHVTGTNGAGNLLLRHQASPSNATGQTSALFADNSGNLAWQNANLSRLTFTANHFTANHAIRFQNKNYTVADSAVVLNRADSNLYVTTHDYNVRKDSVLSLLDTRATSATNNGLTTKVWARGQGIESITSSLSLATGSHQTTYFDILTPSTLNGVAYFQTVAGNYTPNNYNGIAIHRYDVANDTAYLIASSANNGTLWQAAANQWVSVPFTAPVVVQPGPYRVTLYYSSSIQTAAPQVSGATNVSGFVVFVLPNTGRLSGRLTQTTPADFKTSTLGGNNGQPILRIY